VITAISSESRELSSVEGDAVHRRFAALSFVEGDAMRRRFAALSFVEGDAMRRRFAALSASLRAYQLTRFNWRANRWTILQTLLKAFSHCAPTKVTSARWKLDSTH
jgi:hypothetical protein